MASVCTLGGLIPPGATGLLIIRFKFMTEFMFEWVAISARIDCSGIDTISIFLLCPLYR